MKNLFFFGLMLFLFSCANLENVYDDTYDAALKPVEVKIDDESGYGDYIKNNQEGYATVSEKSQKKSIFNSGGNYQTGDDIRYTDRNCDCMSNVGYGTGNRPYWNSGPFSNPNYNYYLTSNNFNHMNCYGNNNYNSSWMSFGYGMYSPYAGYNSYWYNNPYDFYGGYYPYGYNPYGYYGNGYNPYGYYNNSNYNNTNNTNNNGVVAGGTSGNQIYGHRGSTNTVSSNTTSYEHTVRGVSTGAEEVDLNTVTIQNQSINSQNGIVRPVYTSENVSSSVQNNTVKPANNPFAVNSTVQTVDRPNGTVTTNSGHNTISSNQPYQNSYSRYTVPTNSSGTTYNSNTSSTSRNGSNNSTTTTNSSNRGNTNGTSTTYGSNRTTTSGSSSSSSGGTTSTTRTTSSSRR